MSTPPQAAAPGSNVIERCFRDLDEKRLRRGVFKSVPELIDAVMSYIGTSQTGAG